MKKIILLVCLCLCSCNKSIWITERDMKVVSINKIHNYCSYELDLSESISNIYYRDSCGKFYIGDTVNILKK